VGELLAIGFDDEVAACCVAASWRLGFFGDRDENAAAPGRARARYDVAADGVEDDVDIVRRAGITVVDTVVAP
jgi:hypothetical protein